MHHTKCHRHHDWNDDEEVDAKLASSCIPIAADSKRGSGVQEEMKEEKEGGKQEMAAMAIERKTGTAASHRIASVLRSVSCVARSVPTQSVYQRAQLPHSKQQLQGSALMTAARSALAARVSPCPWRSIFAAQTAQR